VTSGSLAPSATANIWTISNASNKPVQEFERVSVIWIKHQNCNPKKSISSAFLPAPALISAQIIGAFLQHQDPQSWLVCFLHKLIVLINR